MSYNRDNGRPGASPGETGRPKRRLKTKPLMILLLILLAGNLLWFIAWLIPDDPGGNEEVASVSGKEISRQEWMAAMEEQHGRETLLDLVNLKVMETAAQEYDIKVSDKEVDLELALMRSARDGSEQTLYSADGERVREKLRAQLILEKVLTKDVVIDESAIEAFYQENQSLYDIPDSYRARLILVKSTEEAQAVIAELENGSSFEALARERSVDAATGSLGGDIGYVVPGQSTIDEAIANAVAAVDVNNWSEPLTMADGRVAVITVTDKAKGRTFTYKDVEGHISRELALEQLPQSVTPEAFWQEFETEWFYGE
ncbi:foldase [Planococcus salinarum]|uniref:peptidylprolyl isomerase n=1 Tax=Planococcus salinarum TaxID=622695 RepID=A0ABX3D2A7_9BACL|nr:peptidyl-prolyl cis-trans isomerase [Planococcus salinarum]OHX51870.1 foldase [Planococcus salinarum]TAA69676.1 foldase [Planococcus salinarum]